MTTAPSIVRALAQRLRRPVSTIQPWHELSRDLKLTPLDLVLVTLDVERAERTCIDVERLTAVHTVSELSTFFLEVTSLTGPAIRR